MSKLGAILLAVWRAGRRGDRAFLSIVTNNFLIFTAYLLRKTGTILYVLLAVLMLFPLSADPLKKIPADRFALWPLSRRERWTLHALSPWLNPVMWVLTAAVVWALRSKVSWGLLAAVAGLFAVGFVMSDVGGGAWETLSRRVPVFPGMLGELIRKDLRQMIATLDFWCAVVLAVATVVYRVADRPVPPEAMLMMTLLVLLALSSYAQCLFGLDGVDGLTRYRLLPLRGWQILLAKDAAFLVVALGLTLALDPLAGLAASVVVLAIGHDPSVKHTRPQIRWRFSSGAGIGNGVVQLMTMSIAANGVARTSVLILLPCFALYGISLWWFGRMIDRNGL